MAAGYEAAPASVITNMTGKSLKQLWDERNNKRSSILTNCELYASYTIANIFPVTGTTGDTPLQNMLDPIGARGLNHMSNKVVSTLFQPQSPFFRLSMDTKARQQLQAVTNDKNATQIAAIMDKIDKGLAEVEKDAIEGLDMVSFRPAATLAAKLLIATGNALMDHHNPDKPVQAFSMRNYTVSRDCDGEMVEFMLHQSKAFSTFGKKVQDALRARAPSNQAYVDETEVHIYTQVKLEDDGKFHAYQAADDVMLDSTGVWTKKDLPWIILTWNLIPGEDYGRGLVEEFSGAFHALKVLYQALINLAGVISDLKWLVKPSSFVDVATLNSSPPGSFHSGNPEDVTAIETNKQHDAQFILTMIEKFEKQISDSFLLMSTRDAERVTSEEIRRDAEELEMSNGGIYSRLAFTWQLPTANIALSRAGYDESKLQSVKPQIITGMDTLSRQSEMDNVRQLFADLVLLKDVPEQLAAAIDAFKLFDFLGRNRQVDVNRFMKTPEQMQQEAQQQMQQNQQLHDQQTGAVGQQEFAKSAAKATAQTGAQ